METWSPEQLKQALDNGEKLFLKVWQKGCGPCKLSEPATRRLEEANPHGLRFVSIVSDDHPEILQIAKVESMPSFFIFADGQKKGQYTGFKGLKKLEEFVSQSMADG